MYHTKYPTKLSTKQIADEILKRFRITRISFVEKQKLQNYGPNVNLVTQSFCSNNSATNSLIQILTNTSL